MRQLTAWICTAPHDLADEEHNHVAIVRSACPHLDQLVDHVRAFADILTRRAGQKLNDWIGAVQADPHRNCTRSSAACWLTTTPSAPA
jgi:hypothetical protein